MVDDGGSQQQQQPQQPQQQRRRSKRQCTASRSKVVLPSAVHYVGYVEDEETPEMIMRKFEELDKLMAASKHPHKQQQASDKENADPTAAGRSSLTSAATTLPCLPASTNPLNDAHSGDVNAQDAQETAAVHEQPRPDPASSCGAASSREPQHVPAADGPLDDTLLLQVFKQTSIFNVRSALAHNTLLLSAPVAGMSAAGRGSSGVGDQPHAHIWPGLEGDDTDPCTEEVAWSGDEEEQMQRLMGFWSDDEGDPSFGQPAGMGKKARKGGAGCRRHGGGGGASKPAGSSKTQQGRVGGASNREPSMWKVLGVAARERNIRQQVVMQYNRDTHALIRRRMQLPGQDDIVQVRVPGPPLPTAWGRTVLPYDLEQPGPRLALSHAPLPLLALMPPTDPAPAPGACAAPQPPAQEGAGPPHHAAAEGSALPSTPLPALLPPQQQQEQQGWDALRPPATALALAAGEPAPGGTHWRYSADDSGCEPHANPLLHAQQQHPWQGEPAPVQGPLEQERAAQGPCMPTLPAQPAMLPGATGAFPGGGLAPALRPVPAGAVVPLEDVPLQGGSIPAGQPASPTQPLWLDGLPVLDLPGPLLPLPTPTPEDLGRSPLIMPQPLQPPLPLQPPMPQLPHPLLPMAPLSPTPLLQGPEPRLQQGPPQGAPLGVLGDQQEHQRSDQHEHEDHQGRPGLTVDHQGGPGLAVGALAAQLPPCATYLEVPDLAMCDLPVLLGAGRTFTVVLINSGWEVQGGDGGDATLVSRLRLLPVPALCPSGFIFIWAHKTHIQGVCKQLYAWGYHYVENLTWVFTHVDNSILRLPSPFCCQSHLTLIIFRREGEGRDIQLRHQRSADVIFDCLRHDQPTLDPPRQLYTVIETMLPEEVLAGRCLELWATPGIRRAGWAHAVQVALPPAPGGTSTLAQSSFAGAGGALTAGESCE